MTNRMTREPARRPAGTVGLLVLAAMLLASACVVVPANQGSYTDHHYRPDRDYCIYKNCR